MTQHKVFARTQPCTCPMLLAAVLPFNPVLCCCLHSRVSCCIPPRQHYLPGHGMLHRPQAQVCLLLLVTSLMLPALAVALSAHTVYSHLG